MLESQTETLKRLSYEDALTGVYNRNRLIEVLNEADNHKFSHLGVAYFDLNGLKIVNDLHGHSAGDELICSVATHLWKVFENRVYRTGGDEFVVVDTELDKIEFIRAVRMAERNMKSGGISFSTGISWRDSDWNMEEQFEEADKLMYQQKRSFYNKRKISRRKLIGNG